MPLAGGRWIDGMLDQVRKATEQLAPERARSCRNAITMASVMIDEVRLRAHAGPLDEPPGGVAFRGEDCTAPAVVTVGWWRLRRWWCRCSLW
jgi:hypothetical protein